MLRKTFAKTLVIITSHSFCKHYPRCYVPQCLLRLS